MAMWGSFFSSASQYFIQFISRYTRTPTNEKIRDTITLMRLMADWWLTRTRSHYLVIIKVWRRYTCHIVIRKVLLLPTWLRTQNLDTLALLVNNHVPQTQTNEWQTSHQSHYLRSLQCSMRQTRTPLDRALQNMIWSHISRNIKPSLSLASYFWFAVGVTNDFSF